MELPQAHKLLQESLDLLRFSKLNVRVCNDAARAIVGPDNRAVFLKIKKHPDTSNDWRILAFENDEAVKMFEPASNAVDIAGFVSDALMASPRTGQR